MSLLSLDLHTVMHPVSPLNQFEFLYGQFFLTSLTIVDLSNIVFAGFSSSASNVSVVSPWSQTFDLLVVGLGL